MFPKVSSLCFNIVALFPTAMANNTRSQMKHKPEQISNAGKKGALTQSPFCTPAPAKIPAAALRLLRRILQWSDCVPTCWNGPPYGPCSAYHLGKHFLCVGLLFAWWGNQGLFVLWGGGFQGDPSSQTSSIPSYFEHLLLFYIIWGASYSEKLLWRGS